MYALTIVLALNGYSVAIETLPFPYVTQATCEAAAKEFLSVQHTNATQLAICLPIDTKMNGLGGLGYGRDTKD